MSLRRVAAIAGRIANGFRRDHRSLGLLFGAPVLVLLLLGWVIRGQAPPNARVAIVNESGPLGTLIVARVGDAARTAGLTVVDVGPSSDAAREALRDGRIDVAVRVWPPGSEGSTGGPVIRLMTPGVISTDDSSSLGAVQRALAKAIAGTGAPTVVHTTLYGSPDADFLDSFAPALLGFFGFFFVFVLTGVSFLRERVGGTLERLLATPVRRSEIVAGYSVGFGMFATLQVVVILLIAFGSLTVPAIGPLPAFDVGLGISNAGSPALAFLIVFLLAIGAVNLGIFLSTFARSELQVIQFIPIVIVPQGLLGGVFWSIGSLPDPLQPVARILPLTYAIDGLRNVLIRGDGLGSAALQLDVLVLLGVAIVFVILGAATIRREVA
jgi:ABC-2 type transport system permease protein